MRRDKIMNTPAIRRMPTYLHKLLKMQSEGKVSVSSTELAEYMNIETIDIGVPVISMHAPYEVISKADIYENYLAFRAFIND